MTSKDHRSGAIVEGGSGAPLTFRRASTAVIWDKHTFVADVSIGHSVHLFAHWGRPAPLEPRTATHLAA
jgi:hypothetical protein